MANNHHYFSTLYSVYTLTFSFVCCRYSVEESSGRSTGGFASRARVCGEPTVQQMEESKLDLIMAGTDSAVLMIEGYCDFLTEDQMLEVSFPGTSHAVPRMPLLSQGHLLLFQGHMLLSQGQLLLPRDISCYPRDICCFPGTQLLQNSQCTYMNGGLKPPWAYPPTPLPVLLP